MAAEVRVFHVTVPAGTAQATPLVTDVSFPARQVDGLEVVVPSGCRGEVGWALAAAGVNVIPLNPGQYVVTDGEIIKWPLEGYHDSGSWSLVAYNTGAFPHTLEVRFLVSLTGGGGAVAQPIPAGTILPVVGGSGGLPTGPGLGGSDGSALPFPVNPGLTNILPPTLAPPTVAPPDLGPPPSIPPPSIPPPSGAAPPSDTSPPTQPSPTIGGTTPSGGKPVTNTPPSIGPRTAYDSTNPDDIPASARLVGLYLDFTTGAQLATWRSRATVVTICRNAGQDAGDVIDSNEGVQLTATPAWVARRRLSGAQPGQYVNRAAWAAARAQFALQGVPEPWWWIADWTGTAHTISGATMVQYVNPPGSGGHFDLSYVPGAIPGIDYTPATGPTRPTVEAGTMNAQEVAASVKLAYQLRAVKQASDAGSKINGDTWEVDVRDAADFNNQVNAVLQGRADLHTIVNNITNV